MLLTCKCLNVTINTKGSELQNVDIADLKLTEEEESDEFFQSEIFTVALGRISKELAIFVKNRNVGNWIVHCCLNCSITTHAIHREKGAAFVLVTKSLLTNPEEIAALKNSEKYSPVYRIIVNDNEDDFKDKEGNSPVNETASKFSDSQMPHAMKMAILALQQQLVDAIHQEAARIDERIRTYSEQQYAALDEFRERAHKQHQVLSRILAKSQEPLSLINSLDELSSPPSSRNSSAQNAFSAAPFSVIVAGNPKNAPQNAESRQQKSPGKQPSAFVDLRHARRTNILSPMHNAGKGQNKTEQMSPRIAGRVATQRNDPSSLDREGLFDLEGMEENVGESFHSEEETDTDDSGSHDEGIHIPKARVLSTNLAQSLPVNVPAFMPRQDGEEREDNMLPQKPDDIAASIKALAKSVHGDSNVFGDLPRPRFSSQI